LQIENNVSEVGFTFFQCWKLNSIKKTLISEDKYLKKTMVEKWVGPDGQAYQNGAD